VEHQRELNQIHPRGYEVDLPANLKPAHNGPPKLQVIYAFPIVLAGRSGLTFMAIITANCTPSSFYLAWAKFIAASHNSAPEGLGDRTTNGSL